MNTSGDREASSTPLGNLDAFFLFLIMMVSFGIRYWRISLPAGVVFDEVYFGNFSNFYIHSQFFHDVHPPLGKIIMAIIANLSEYDGSINFQNCPKGYPSPDYVQLRITPATFSALCYPLLYISMRFMNFGYLSSLTAAISALFDTLMATEGRHILSDGMLHFFSCLHICMISFTLSIPARRQRFWRWHLLTGVTLGCACSCKNTAWGLIAFDAVCYSLVLSDCLCFGFIEYLIEIVCFGLPLAFICLSTYFAIFSLHFVLLPYSGPGADYLNENMRAQLVLNPVAGLFARRLRGRAYSCGASSFRSRCTGVTWGFSSSTTRRASRGIGRFSGASRYSSGRARAVRSDALGTQLSTTWHCSACSRCPSRSGG
jgi:dolichyl-phosphate-mannose--protein O-mannosyl transferase